MSKSEFDDFEQTSSPRRRKQQGGDPKNFITPGFLFLSLIFFFLPWINVTCNGQSLATQSGLQAATGKLAMSSEFESMAKAGDPSGKGGGQMGQSDTDKAPLLWLVLLTVVAGIIFGLLACPGINVIPGLRTPLIAMILAGVTFLLLTVQMVMGFPIRKSVEDQIEKDKKQKAQMQALQPKGAPPNPMGDIKMELKASFTPWFWMAYLTPVVPVVVLGIAMCLPQTAPRRHARRDDYDDDDDDDRPRRRARRDDDD